MAAKSTIPEETPTTTKPKFRYYCHGCTKDAGYFDEVKVGEKVTCPHCGKEQVTVEENFIKI